MRPFGKQRRKTKLQKTQLKYKRLFNDAVSGSRFLKKGANVDVECKICKQTIKSKLLSHIYTHLPHTKLYKCTICNQSSNDRSIVDTHMKNIHGDQVCTYDNRWRYMGIIKDCIRTCFPSRYIDREQITIGEVIELKRKHFEAVFAIEREKLRLIRARGITPNRDKKVHFDDEIKSVA
uniref:C2H2-type domain-containing protein n=1 Tax=Meloidogyne incognita TaxID=6306 RepID=A0A914MBB7_MELIC